MVSAGYIRVGRSPAEASLVSLCSRLGSRISSGMLTRSHDLKVILGTGEDVLKCCKTLKWHLDITETRYGQKSYGVVPRYCSLVPLHHAAHPNTSPCDP